MTRPCRARRNDHSANCCSSAGAKATWPPSPGRTRHDSPCGKTMAMPSPVPAPTTNRPALSRASPACKVNRSDDDAVTAPRAAAAKSFARFKTGRPKRRDNSSASMLQGKLVSRAERPLSATGPATAIQPPLIDAGRVCVSLKKAASRLVKSAKSALAYRRSTTNPPSPARPSSDFVPPISPQSLIQPPPPRCGEADRSPAD